MYAKIRDRVGNELQGAGWDVFTGYNYNPAGDYVHWLDVIVGPDITDSPHPLFRITLGGLLDGGMPNLQVYETCTINFDWQGPNSIPNNGGYCTDYCTNFWLPADYDVLREAAFARALGRCVGLGGETRRDQDLQRTDSSCWPALGPGNCAVLTFEPMGNGALRTAWVADSRRAYVWNNAWGAPIGTLDGNGEVANKGTGLLATFVY
ncbi:MAG: hypothetical protein ABI895_19710 [Deltaproteobacteria bacterium]